jgi:hypothetical protein
VVEDCAGLPEAKKELCLKAGNYFPPGSLTAQSISSNYSRRYRGNVTVSGSLWTDDVFIGGKQEQATFETVQVW